ncbi:MAG: ATP-binding protein [Aggregatilineales bacterium]
MSEAVDDLCHILKGGRTARLDWAAEQTPVAALAATLAALANSHGGTLLIGVVGPAGSVLGVRDSASTVDRVLEAALAIEPPLILSLPRVETCRGQQVVVVTVPPGMPHVYSYEGRYLRREGPENMPLKPPELRRLIMERGEASFETEIARGATLDDIAWQKAEAFVASLTGRGDNDVKKVLFKRGCLGLVNGELRPTNAGILLFGKEPQRHVRGADITAARFAGETMSDTFSRQDIGGTLPDQIRRAETFLVDHLRKGVQIGQTMARSESFEYPLEAVRELVVNAVAHRDYSISGDGIRLFIFRNRMEITSPGTLPGPVTIENIKDERFSRNPVIVQALSDMGFIERLGYGVDRVIDLMRQQQLEAPEFIETAGGFRVVLRSTPVNPSEQASSAPDQPGSVVFNGRYDGHEINPRQEAALIFLHTAGNTRITNSDLQALCPDVHPETIRRDLADLVSKDILLKMGEKRGSYYVLRRS